jgi:hypothetical protein
MKHAKSKKNEKVEELNFEKPDYIFQPNGFHLYRQEGYYLVCRGCELVHAVYIGSEKIMVGQDEKGQPIIKSRKELGMN